MEAPTLQRDLQTGHPPFQVQVEILYESNHQFYSLNPEQRWLKTYFCTTKSGQAFFFNGLGRLGLTEAYILRTS